MSTQLQDPTINDTSGSISEDLYQEVIRQVAQNDDDFVTPHGAPDADDIIAASCKYGNRTMVRYTVKCPNCDWASHNYAKYKTALLIATEHRENSCLTGRRRSRNVSIASTPDMKATTLFRTGKIN